MLPFFKKIFAAMAPVPAPIHPDVPAPQSTPRARTVGPTVAIINKSSVISDAEVAPVVDALQIQVDRDFVPIWEIGANLVFVPSNQPVPNDAWLIFLLDTSDQAGALGYHELTTSGMPVAKVFAADDKRYGLSWSVTLSHELLEMLVDPYLTSSVFVQNSNTTGTIFAYEVCDAVEDDSFGYLINSVLVSDFVAPAWFESFRAPASARFSFGNHVQKPFELAHGGYISYFSVGPNCHGWAQATGPSGPGRRLLSKGAESRKSRRGRVHEDVSVP